MSRRWIAVSAAIILAFTLAVMAAAPKAEPASAAAEEAAAYALIEAETGRLLFAKNADTPLPMASTTKIMTALVTLQNSSPDELVRVPDEAVGVEGSSVYLQRGESMTVRDLLYGLMLASGNDAAVALAVHVGGSVTGFVEMMNAKAAELGLAATRFVTPNGLDAEGHRTTAYELCLITREAMKNADFREMVSTKYYRTESGACARTFKNKNTLLWDYEGAFGVKTGYTSGAGRCLVYGAEREGMELIGCVLNCRPMFEAASRMMDEAFDEYEKIVVVPAGQPAGKTYIREGAENVLEVSSKSSIIAVMRKGERLRLTTRVDLPEYVEAPVSRGQTVGRLSVYDGDELVGETELVAEKTVPKTDLGFWWRLLASLFAA